MTKTEIVDLVTPIFKNLPMENRQQLAEAVVVELYENEGFEYIERDLLGSGGQVGLLHDLVSLEDARHILDAVFDGFTLKEQVKLLVRLVKFLRTLRIYREEVSNSEIRVMLAVRRGNSDISSIANSSGLSEQEVIACVTQLQNRKYRREIPLIEKDIEGKICTRF